MRLHCEYEKSLSRSRLVAQQQAHIAKGCEMSSQIDAAAPQLAALGSLLHEARRRHGVNRLDAAGRDLACAKKLEAQVLDESLTLAEREAASREAWACHARVEDAMREVRAARERHQRDSLTALVAELRRFARSQPPRRLDRTPVVIRRIVSAGASRGSRRQPTSRRQSARSPDPSEPGPALDWKRLSALTLFEAGVTQQRGIVRVPYRLPDGREHNAKLFRVRGHGSWWETTGKSLVPFGLERVPLTVAGRAGMVLVVAEGESDALAIREAFALDRDGASFVVLGLPGSSTWRSEWVGLTRGWRRVYVAADGDQAGTRMLERIWEDVPRARWVPIPDGEDSRSILQAPGGRDRFGALLDDADLSAVRSAGFRAAPTLAEFERFVGEVAR